MTDERVITHVSKDDRDNIVEVGAAGLWREPVEKVIADLQSDAPKFSYRSRGKYANETSAVIVVNARTGAYLRTVADRTRGNNLDELPSL